MGSLSFEAHPSGRTQKPWSGPECPSCGSVVTKVGTSGKDMDDRPLRDRRCRDCGASFVTVEAVVPDVKFSEVDVEHKRRARESKRKRFGWTEHRDRQKRLTRKVIVSVRAGAPRRRA